MNELDDKIREALEEESTANLMDPDREASIQAMVGESFRGRSRWATLIALKVRVLLTVASVIAAVMFFQVDGTRELIAWASLFVVTVTLSGIIGLWYWIFVNRNSIMLEVKRLELQIARLASQERG